MKNYLKILFVTVIIITPMKSQSLDYLFNEGTNTLLSSSYPVIVGFANEYYGNNTLPFDYLRNNNYIDYSNFFITFSPEGLDNLNTDQQNSLKSAVYGQYLQIVYYNWNNVINAKINQDPGVSPKPYNPPSCVNSGAGNVWEVFYIAYNNNVIYQNGLIINGYQEKFNPEQAITAALNAVKVAFPCYSGGIGGGALPSGYIPTWEEIWGRFLALVVRPNWTCFYF